MTPAGAPSGPARPSSSARAVAGGLALVAAALWVLLARYHSRQLGDDAFVYFRYARHVVEGLGPTWNAGYRVEGFSSPLWLGLMIAGARLGFDLPAWACALGLALSAWSVAASGWLALRLSASRVAAAGACVLVALVHGLHYWAGSGLETALFAALVLACCVALASTRPAAWAAPAALLGLARPEAPLLVAAFVAAAAAVHGRAALRPRALALALAPAAAYMAFRLAYYGHPFPNPYYAKATGPLSDRLVAGAVYARHALALFAVAAAGVAAAKPRGAPARAIAAWLACALGLVVAGGGDWMRHDRLAVPIVLPLVAVAVASAARLRPAPRAALMLALLASLAPLFPRPRILEGALALERLPEVEHQEGTLVPTSLEVARFIAARYPADALVAVNHAGALPYALPNPVLDMVGLNDLHIAHDVEGGLHEKFDVDYVLARRPRVVVLNSRTRPGTDDVFYHPGYWEGETALVASPAFVASYRPVPRFWEWRWGRELRSYVVLFERREDAPAPP